MDKVSKPVTNPSVNYGLAELVAGTPGSKHSISVAQARRFLRWYSLQSCSLSSLPRNWICDIDFMKPNQMFSITFLGLNRHGDNHACLPNVNHEALELEYNTTIAQYLYWNFSLNLKCQFSYSNMSMAKIANELELDEHALNKMYVIRGCWFSVSRENLAQATTTFPNWSPSFNYIVTSPLSTIASRLLWAFPMTNAFKTFAVSVIWLTKIHLWYSFDIHWHLMPPIFGMNLWNMYVQRF